MFLNLSPYLFKDITSASGPIEKIDLFEFHNSIGAKQFEAHAYLRSPLKGKNAQIANSQIYGDCDGSGTSSSKISAVRKSISEAIERWAFYTLVTSESAEYGLALDDHLSGFARLPFWPR